MAAPILGGQTLADPTDYKRSYTYRGGRQIMADGSQVIDLVNASAKASWRLAWPALTDAQASALQTAFAAIKDTSGSYTDIDGSAYTVMLAEGFDTLEFEHVRAVGGNRWAAALELRQV
jgi:hypothetical protein